MKPYGPTLTHWVEENVKDKEAKQSLLLLTNYRFITGLRGPDDDSVTARAFKRLITQRLRGVVAAYMWKAQPHLITSRGDVTHTPLRVDQYVELQSVCRDAVEEATRPYTNPMYHFLEHLVSAVGEIEDHPIWDGRGKEIIALLEDTIHQLGMGRVRKERQGRS